VHRFRNALSLHFSNPQLKRVAFSSLDSISFTSVNFVSSHVILLTCLAT
jgi:hypothetical protein